MTERSFGYEAPRQPRYTAADAVMETLADAGVSCMFANLGSDHPAMIESWAKAEQTGNVQPEIVICPHEMVALSAAHGYYLVSGEAQALLLHVDVGTQNLGGTLHNAQRGRIPALILAGSSPFTMEGEKTGGRNEYIHFYQDTFDQRGFVRPNTKFDYEMRTGQNIPQVLLRSLQIAKSDPAGPVYVMLPREVLEEEIRPVDVAKGWDPIAPTPLPEDGAHEIAQALAKAQYPLIVTTSLGRKENAVHELEKLSERYAIPVVEAGPYYMNLPWDHPMHLGYNRNAYVAESDCIVVIDSDVPWIPSQVQPAENAEVYYIDPDPLKEDIPLWYIPSTRFFRADPDKALQQLNAQLDTTDMDADVVQERYRRCYQEHQAIREGWEQKEHRDSERSEITPEYLTACVRDVIGERSVVLNETVSNAGAVWKHLRRRQTGTLFGSGGSSLGWNGGAAIGAKMADPDRTVVSLTGDGSYIFSCPTAVHWMAHRYQTPFLTVIYNNRGWHSPKKSTLGVYPEGRSRQRDRYWVRFDPQPQLDEVAEAAGGAYAQTVDHPNHLHSVLEEALNQVEKGRCAVVNAVLPPVSEERSQ